MRKFLVIAIPIVTLALFIFIMLSSSVLKKPFGKNDDIEQKIEEIIENINNETWDKAIIEAEKLDKAWRRVLKRIQFSSERDEINFISSNIARIQGAVLAEDKTNSLIELYDAYNHWKRLGN